MLSLFTVLIKNQNDKISKVEIGSEDDLGRCLLCNKGKQVKVYYAGTNTYMTTEMIQRRVERAKRAA